MTYFALIGNTPMVKVEHDIFAKLEYFNPFGSIKDRFVLELFEGDASEFTSGNTGISLSAFSSVFGRRAEIFLPDNVTKERIKLIEILGAELHLVNAEEFRQEKKREELRSTMRYSVLGQYTDERAVNAGVKVGKEIKKVLDPDFVVTGVGTGATAEGLARVFGEDRVVGVIGNIPGLARERLYARQLRKEIRIVTVDFDIAKKYTLQLVRKGVFAGFSTGANYFVARNLSGKRVIIAHDTIYRYLSSL